MDKKTYKSKPQHLVTDSRNGTIKKIVHSADTDIGTQDNNQNLRIHGTVHADAYIGVQGGSGGNGADPEAQYVVVSATGSLLNERVLTAGTGISLSDGGPGGALTIASTALAGADPGAHYVVLSATGSLTNERVLTSGVGILLTDAGAGNAVTITAFGNPQEPLPSSYTGLKLWLEAAADNVTLDNTAPESVSQWNDLSGLGNHVTQVTKAKQPRWHAANPILSGSQPSLEFWSGQVLISPSISLTSFTLVIALVAKSDGTMYIEHSADANSNNGSWIFGSISTGTGASILVRRNATLSGKNHVALSSIWASHDDWPTVWTHMYSGTQKSNRLYVRNVDVTGGDANNNDAGIIATNQPLYIGARGTTPTLASSGSIFGLALYSPAISTQQAGSVARYFAKKYGFHCS